jgi:hypothetical protein
MPLIPGEVISYLQMCAEEGASLQRGMNFKLRSTHSVVLMSLRAGAPYEDVVIEDGKALIYEGHDVGRLPGGPDPKKVDQPMVSPAGTPTQNGLFFQAAQAAKRGTAQTEPVRVYEKLRTGIWVYGAFPPGRCLAGGNNRSNSVQIPAAGHRRAPTSERPKLRTRSLSNYPTAVKLEVWKRDKGRCVKCGDAENLHFDHDIPYSKGGSSLVARNIQLLCAKHNLAKHDRLE